ncbi:DUF1761 domain-containing protein [Hoeflea sp. YIM 152468]|uniref:DUF1761 domain-containing protein n=1 Tax=Hoeflea sp. YIM 152468 TaxID=3031759 RepID=UPI0023DCB738|nr:DUF1761 domain-containing protein [Hoeflea sp. YIM 152468]MDF1607238.1 DUF1761 domain-containing protein [Hoeflea sp. YIM 152468]
MSEITTGVSWFAVLIGAVVSFLAGWLWYSPMLFGPKWAKGVGVEMGTASTMPVAAMVTQFAGLVLMSWFVGVTAAANALSSVILATLAFTVLAYSGGLFTKKSAYARNVEAGYWIASLVIMILSQGLVRSL